VAKTVAETLVSVDIVALNRLRALKGEVCCIGATRPVPDQKPPTCAG
jgi:hypothetical protein